MSDSVQPHRLQPTRFPHPWDSLGKNTGVGCHFLLQCVKVKSESEVAQSCPTLSGPSDCSLPGSSIHGIFQAGVLDWGAIAFSATALGTSQKTSETVKHTSPFLKPCHSSYEGDACVSRKKILLSFDKKTNSNFFMHLLYCGKTCIIFTLLTIFFLRFCIKIFIGVQLLYNVVLVSTIQQSESAIHIHISPSLLSLPPTHPFLTSRLIPDL